MSGHTATFSVVASGSAPLSYQWAANGAAISGATGVSYSTPTEATSNSGTQFTVTVSNLSGSASSNAAVLTVTAPVTAPSISTQPVSQSIVSGRTATFSIVASGSAPLSYQWAANGAAIGGATGASYTTPTESTSNSGTQFTVTVSNSAGSATSNASVLTVTAPVTAPSISTQPASQSIVSGQTATFSVVASGSATLSYQWSANGAAIGGATGASYTTPAEITSNSGTQFTVSVSNSAGSATSNAAVLTVTAPVTAPSISAQPANQNILSGQTATFFVAVSGSAPLSYQWAANGAAIGGATGASYTTPAETTSNSGTQFTVTVSNSAGSSTSNTAVLTVGSLPTLSPSLSSVAFNSVNVGSSSMLSVTLSDSGSASITVTGVSLSGAGFTVSGVSSGLILQGGQSATLNVTFAPAATGGVSGSVTIASSASNASLVIGLSGTGAQAATPATVTLNWDASGSSVVGYDVFRSAMSGSGYTQLNSSPITSMQYTDTSVQAGQTYYYVVTAVNSAGVQSIYSNQSTITIP